MRFANDKEAFEFLDERKSAFETTGQEVCERTGISACYYEGIQWIHSQGAGKIGRYDTVVNPDRNDLRVTTNRISREVNKLEAQTFPSQINATCAPLERAYGSEEQFRAQTLEDTLNLALDDSRYLPARRQGNHGRTVMGTYGIGLRIEAVQRVVMAGGKPERVPDLCVRAFSFEPTKLILDPFQTSRDLRDHDEVIYRDVWTLSRIRAVFPEIADKIVADECPTVGELASQWLAINALSLNRVYSRYREQSKTKGAIVYQIHSKGDDGRWGDMQIVVEGCFKGADRIIINADDQSSPFGGDGLPLALLHGHRRHDSPWSISDVAMMVDDQNRINLLDTLTFRHLQAMATATWVVDKSWFGTAKIDEGEIRSQLTNRPGGVTFGNTRVGPGPKPSPPQLIQPPPPHPFISELKERYQIDLKDQVHRPEITSGATKSHVPDRTFQTAIEQADKVGSMRIREDLETDRQMLGVLLGTYVRHIKQAVPGSAAMLREHGFEIEEFKAIVSTEDTAPRVSITIAESAVRHRSHEARRRELIDARVREDIDAHELRSAMAKDLDSPITDDDRLFEQQASRAAIHVSNGIEWEAVPLGRYGPVFIEAFRRALISRRASHDPEARARLQNAIQSQTEMNLAEAIQSNPELALQRELQNQQAAQAQAQQQAPEQGAQQPSATGSASVSDLLAALTT